MVRYQVLIKVRRGATPPGGYEDGEVAVGSGVLATECAWIVASEWTAWMDGGSMPTALAAMSTVTQAKWQALIDRIAAGSDTDVRANVISQGGMHTHWGWADLKKCVVADIDLNAGQVNSTKIAKNEPGRLVIDYKTYLAGQTQLLADIEDETVLVQPYVV